MFFKSGLNGLHKAIELLSNENPNRKEKIRIHNLMAEFVDVTGSLRDKDEKLISEVVANYHASQESLKEAIRLFSTIGNTIVPGKKKNTIRLVKSKIKEAAYLGEIAEKKVKQLLKLLKKEDKKLAKA